MVMPPETKKTIPLEYDDEPPPRIRELVYAFLAVILAIPFIFFAFIFNWVKDKITYRTSKSISKN